MVKESIILVLSKLFPLASKLQSGNSTTAVTETLSHARQSSPGPEWGPGLLSESVSRAQLSQPHLCAVGFTLEPVPHGKIETIREIAVGS